MAEIAALRRQLTIKTGVTKRVYKEYELYRKEAESGKLKVDKLAADGVPSDQWEYKNAVKLTEETDKMIIDAATRLQGAVQDLRTLVISAKKEEALAEDEALKSAEETLETVSA